MPVFMENIKCFNIRKSTYRLQQDLYAGIEEGQLTIFRFLQTSK